MICLVPPATIRTRGLPLTKRLLCQLSYGGLGLHFGCAHTRASRRMWCLAARDLGFWARAHPAPPTPCRAATECMGTPEVARSRERRTTTALVVVVRALVRIREICATNIRPVPVSLRAKLSKSIRTKVRRCDPSIAGCAERKSVGSE